ncbi:MAG: hypothetical protein IM591_01390 [Chitinophagaceae bacterium]|jgi:hypothetical protein|nr:hypothetical protein [Chitinophagaceae bacterium]MCA6469030.1 hypothetical protein [Chitinophagaceae bacterium]
MEKDFINLQTGKRPEVIEVKTQTKLVPKRTTIIYELTTPKDESISKKDDQEQSKDLPG